jgi:type IV secretion system protein VirD4
MPVTGSRHGGHLMVSRSETARPLLTPGEIMQLPAGNEIVMLAGTPPIRAKKARYFEDPRLRERILPPPAPKARAEPEPDDWTVLPLPLPPPGMAAAPVAVKTQHESTDSELRRQPELDPPAVAEPPLVNEFEIDAPDEADDLAASSSRMAGLVRGVARQIALDPDDGMEL